MTTERETLTDALSHLSRVLELHEGDCRRDHHGLCQTHGLELDCRVAAARRFLADRDGTTPPAGPVVELYCDRHTGEVRIMEPGELSFKLLGLAPGECQRFRLAPVDGNND